MPIFLSKHFKTILKKKIITKCRKYIYSLTNVLTQGIRLDYFHLCFMFRSLKMRFFSNCLSKLNKFESTKRKPAQLGIFLFSLPSFRRPLTIGTPTKLCRAPTGILIIIAGVTATVLDPIITSRENPPVKLTFDSCLAARLTEYLYKHTCVINKAKLYNTKTNVLYTYQQVYCTRLKSCVTCTLHTQAKKSRNKTKKKIFVSH